ncbi:MAG: hypothetical protein M3M84_07600 [Thermoproteota archaeon]|nr:hypothetical protein [Thermoproteota archaeon]
MQQVWKDFRRETKYIDSRKGLSQKREFERIRRSADARRMVRRKQK